MDSAAIIFKVLSGEASDAEKRMLSDWIARSKDNQVEFNDLKLLWENRTGIDESDEHFQAGLQKIKGVMRLKDRKRKGRRRNLMILMLITMLLLAIFASVYLYPRLDQEPGNYLKFDNASLRHIIYVLERSTEIQIEVENSDILECRFTGSFYRIDASNTIVRSISSALNLQYESTGDGVYRLTGNGCPVSRNSDLDR